MCWIFCYEILMQTYEILMQTDFAMTSLMKSWCSGCYTYEILMLMYVLGSNPRPNPFYLTFLQNNTSVFAERPRMPSVSQPPSRIRQTPDAAAERRVFAEHYARRSEPLCRAYVYAELDTTRTLGIGSSCRTWYFSERFPQAVGIWCCMPSGAARYRYGARQIWRFP